VIQIAGDRTCDRAISEIFCTVATRPLSRVGECLHIAKKPGFLPGLKLQMQYGRKKTRFLRNFRIVYSRTIALTDIPTSGNASGLTVPAFSVNFEA